MGTNISTGKTSAVVVPGSLSEGMPTKTNAVSRRNVSGAVQYTVPTNKVWIITFLWCGENAGDKAGIYDGGLHSICYSGTTETRSASGSPLWILEEGDEVGISGTGGVTYYEVDE